MALHHCRQFVQKGLLPLRLAMINCTEPVLCRLAKAPVALDDEGDRGSSRVFAELGISCILGGCAIFAGPLAEERSIVAQGINDGDVDVVRDA